MGTRLAPIPMDWLGLVPTEARYIAEKGEHEGEGWSALGRGVVRGVDTLAASIVARRERNQARADRREELNERYAQADMANDRANLGIVERRLQEARDRAAKLSVGVQLDPNLAQDPGFAGQLETIQKDVQSWEASRAQLEARLLGGRLRAEVNLAPGGKVKAPT